MKITHIQLDYFLKHEHLRVDLTEGLNVIRGQNEAGKTSVLEGLGYNLFGSTALEGTLEETVNWGAASKSALKTETGFEHRGVHYKCLRGVSGAELWRQGEEVPVCTGHKEVTAYIENLLGLPPGRSQHTILAGQNAIRGVLSLGPTAATEFIEKLGDFSELDSAIKSITGQLTTGSTKPLEALRLVSQTQLNELIIPEIIDRSNEIAELESTAETLHSKIDGFRSAYQAANEAYSRQQEKKEKLEGQLATANTAVVTSTSRLATVNALLAEKEADARRLSEIQVVVDQAAERAVYDRFKALAETWGVDSLWEGTEDGLLEAIAETERQIKDCEHQVTRLASQIDMQFNSKITTGACPTCGTIIGNPEEAARHNESVDAEISRLNLEKAGVTSKIPALQLDVEELKYLLELQAQIKQWEAERPGLLNYDKTTIPWGVTWSLEVPPIVDVTGLYQQAAALQTKLNQAADADTRRQVITAELTQQQQRSAEIQQELSDLLGQAVSPPDRNLLDQIAALEASKDACHQEISKLKDEVSAAKATLAAIQAQRSQLENQLVQFDAQIQTQREDTAFVGALKEARILVAEKLWGIVMGGVSNYFSRLRGTPSVVLRSGKGFAVDGKTSRPSGSTLDILGLALRIVISKIFADCGLLVIDEPSAGCDATRTGNMVEVMAGAGFEQVIWVTHDDATESWATNLIEL